MWAFEVYEDRTKRQWRWRLKSHGRIVAGSGEGYASQSNAKRAAENVRGHIGSAKITVVPSEAVAQLLRAIPRKRAVKRRLPPRP